MGTWSHSSAADVIPSWSQWSEGAGRPARAGASPRMLRLRDGSREAPAEEGAVLECRDEQVMEPATTFADFTSLPSTTVGSHGLGSQTDRGWETWAGSPPELGLKAPPPLPRQNAKNANGNSSPPHHHQSQGCWGKISPRTAWTLAVYGQRGAPGTGSPGQG